MTPSQRIAEDIQDLLRRNVQAPSALSALAADYAAQCRKVNARLEQIREILDLGDERQALLLGEADPPVMDEADALCFPKAAHWRELCASQQLVAAPELKAKIVQRLNLVYSKGITANHAIYKEFRTAVLSRDDNQALSLARTIAKLNSSDANAKSECERLEKKVFRARTAHLQEATEAGLEDAILEALKQVEALGMDELAGADAAVLKARETRARVAARGAQTTITKHLSEIAKSESSALWQLVGELISRIDRLRVEHQIHLSGDQNDELNRARLYFSKNQELAVKRVQHREALNSLLSHAELVESRTQARGTVPLTDLRDMLTLLNRYWQTVESFALEVEEAVIQRVSMLADRLRTEISRLQKKRLLAVSAMIVAATAFFGFSGWYLLGVYRAGELAKAINSSVESREIASTAKLIKDAGDRKLDGFSTKLLARIETARAWMEDVAQASKSAGENLATFEKMMDDPELSSREPVDIYGQLQTLKQEISDLPAESQTEFKVRLSRTDEFMKDWLAKKLASFTEILDHRLEEFQTTRVPGLEKKQSLASLKVFVAGALEEVTSWETLMGSGIDGFALPPDLTARAEGYKNLIAEYAGEIAAADAAVDTLANAKDFPGYQAGIEKLAAVDAPSINDIRQARLTQTLATGPDELMSVLLFPWDPAAWAAVKNGGESIRMYPDSILPAEDRTYDGLLNDSHTKDIFEADIEGKPNRTIYTLGAPLNAKTDQTPRFYSGRIYDPDYDGDVIRFRLRSLNSNALEEDSDYASRATDIEPSGSSVTFEAMDLRRFISPEGNVSLSVWEILDRATGARQKDPLYDAFVAQVFQRMTAVRPHAWGLHFCPSGKHMFETLDNELGGTTLVSGAWMLSDWKKRFAKKVEFVAAKRTNFRQEAVYIQTLALACAKSGLAYAGFIGPDGIPVLFDSGTFPENLWGLSLEGEDQVPARLFVRRQQDGTPEYLSLSSSLPLAPLYKFSGDRKNIWEQAWKEASLDSENDSVVITPPLFSDLIPHD